MPVSGDKMNATEFRKELAKAMPGYAWTVHRPSGSYTYIAATGIQTSGFNRISTLQVVRREKSGSVEYEVKSAGFGKSAQWLATRIDGTLARALRALQNHYEAMAATYSSHALDLKSARTAAVKA